MNVGVELISYQHQQSQALLGTKGRMHGFQNITCGIHVHKVITRINTHVNHPATLQFYLRHVQTLVLSDVHPLCFQKAVNHFTITINLSDLVKTHVE